MTEPFDLRTHIFDKNGVLVKAQPYRLFCKGQTKLFERPPGSGIMYYENGELAEESKAKLAEIEAAKIAAEAKAQTDLMDKVQEEATKLKQAQEEAAAKKLQELKNVAKK